MTTAVVKQEMAKVLQLLEDDLRTLRPGRASGELVGILPVEAYGGTMPLNQLASISANEQGQIIIAPFDKSVLPAIDTAVSRSQLGYSVTNEGTQLRLSVPPLSEERRAEMVKLVGQKGEAARIQLRQFRGEAHQKASREKSAGTMREDELNRFTKEIDETIGEFNKSVKELVERKEKELMTV